MQPVTPTQLYCACAKHSIKSRSQITGAHIRGFYSQAVPTSNFSSINSRVKCLQCAGGKREGQGKYSTPNRKCVSETNGIR